MLADEALHARLYDMYVLFNKKTIARKTFAKKTCSAASSIDQFEWQ